MFQGARSAPGTTTQLTILAVVVLFIGYRVYQRTRAQKVHPWRTVLYTALIVLASVFGIVGTGQIPVDPAFLVLAPIAVVGGYWLGMVMMRSIRFWRDDATGDLWMQGGVAYIGVWLATYAVRLGARYALSGSLYGDFFTKTPSAVGGLAELPADLLLLSVGLWIARAVALVQKYRSNAKTVARA